MNKYVKNNGLKNRKFGSLEEENDFLLHWETTVADTRIHGTTKQQVPVDQTSSRQAGTTGVHAAASDHPQHRRLWGAGENLSAPAAAPMAATRVTESSFDLQPKQFTGRRLVESARSTRI